MSQETVALIVKRLLTDRRFRIQFSLEPLDTLLGVQREGRELTVAEIVALVQANAQMWFSSDDKRGLRTLRHALVAFEKNRQRLPSLTAGADVVVNAADLGQSHDSAGRPDGQRTFKVEGTDLSAHDSGPSPTQRQRDFRWLLLALLCFVVAFILGFASGSANAAQDKPRFETNVTEERECVQLDVRPGVMWPLSSSDIHIEARIARHAHHRQLAIAWDGGVAGGGSSVQSLHGEDGDSDAGGRHTMTLRSFPFGTAFRSSASA